MTDANHRLLDHLSTSFAPAERVLPVMLRRHAARFADQRLVVIGDTTWTYAQTLDRAEKAAGKLAAAGIAHGDRVAILCGNRPEFLEIFLGCAWIGAVIVPINTAAKGPQLQYVLGNCGARLLVVESALAGALDFADLSGMPLETIWRIGDVEADAVQGRRCLALPQAGEALIEAPVKPGDSIALIYTSGTTGPSKGVCCPHAQYFWWGATSAAALGVHEGDVLFSTLPLFHINALNTFAQALLTGATFVLEPRFSASGFWPSAAHHGATVTYLLGAMVPILLARDPSQQERDHKIRIALGPGVPGHLHRVFLQRTGIALLEAYGSTETNFVIGRNLDEQRIGTMGRVRDGFEARVVDAEDNPVPNGEPGELVLRADQPYTFATGYFGMAEKTVEAWRNLWFHTGDRVMRDADGYFRFVDRLKDAIRRRGENISSFEVEQVLLSHPEIEIAAVYPVGSELAEDEVMASLVRRPGSTLDAQQLIEFCRPRLPYFAVPRFVDFVTELPRTENGKIQKYKLRETGVTPTTWDGQLHGNDPKHSLKR
jgi:crotonobetaine/carnitine-CoA ligase